MPVNGVTYNNGVMDFSTETYISEQFCVAAIKSEIQEMSRPLLLFFKFLKQIVAHAMNGLF